MTRKEKEQLARKQFIIDAAAAVFAKHGYENSSMNEIAARAEFTKRTLYQYFEDKADLYLSVLVDRYGILISSLVEEDYQDLSGIDAIQQSILKYYACYKEHLDTFRIMYDFGIVRNLTENPKSKEFLAIDMRTTQFIVTLVERGQSDGTVSTKWDPMTTSIHLKFLISAVFDELVMVGRSYSQHIGASEDEFAHGLFDMIVDMMRSR